MSATGPSLLSAPSHLPANVKRVRRLTRRKSFNHQPSRDSNPLPKKLCRLNHNCAVTAKSGQSLYGDVAAGGSGVVQRFDQVLVARDLAALTVVVGQPPTGGAHATVIALARLACPQRRCAAGLYISSRYSNPNNSAARCRSWISRSKGDSSAVRPVNGASEVRRVDPPLAGHALDHRRLTGLADVGRLDRALGGPRPGDPQRGQPALVSLLLGLGFGNRGLIR